MDIGPYISELLQHQKYVVLPGFGAFVANHRPARFDVQTARLLPPSRTITFQPELNLNDGILLNYVARAEDIPAPLAHKELEAYCDELLYKLDHNETINLNRLGTLSRNGQDFRFEAFPEAETLDGAFGLEPIHPASLGKTAGVRSVAQDAPLSPSKKTAWWLYAALLILLATAGASVYLGFFDVETSQTAVAPQTSLPEILPPAEPAPEQEVLVVEAEGPAEELMPRDLEITHPNAGYHYLVGGSFRTDENAIKYMSQLTAKGSESIYLGWINNFYLVALSATKDEEEAIELKNKFLAEKPQSGVWVYTHNE